jgi:hypothetical protein
MLCLVVEFLGEEPTFPPFTRAHPGATVDLMVEPDDPGRAVRSEFALVRGASLAATDALVRGLAATHAPVEPLRRDPAAGLWFGRLHFQPSRLDTPSARALDRIKDFIGPPWVHVESGVVLLRARLRDAGRADEAVERAQAAMAGEGLEAQVVAQEVSPRDHGVWEQLVQHGLGITL